tara:strand:- start:90461 stop:91354 length:894 start_codon:yes stop_codon:yes gene_type:complete
VGVKTSFSIKDLENLSGVKAHTIRIWEKRYALLTPERSDTNIRTYNIVGLQKLLNVAFLNDNGIKVSKIAEFSDSEIYSKVKELSLNNDSDKLYISTFKVAMLNFDQELFDVTYNKMLATCSFREIFQGTFLQLLDEIGLLWMTNTITPAHEHFISTLIQQKLQINIERVQGASPNADNTFVLFLPLNEIHELGLMYLHFELLLKGYKSIYLGPSVPVENLLELKKIFNNITFISYFTVAPEMNMVPKYLEKFTSLLLENKNEHLYILGRNTKGLDVSSISSQISVHDKISDLLKSV